MQVGHRARDQRQQRHAPGRRPPDPPVRPAGHRCPPGPAHPRSPTCTYPRLPRCSPRNRPTANASPAPVASIWSAATASTCSSLEAAYASAPALPHVTTTHFSRSPDTERTASKTPAELTSLYCVSDPTTMAAGHVVASGTGGDVTRKADSAAAAVPVGYLYNPRRRRNQPTSDLARVGAGKTTARPTVHGDDRALVRIVEQYEGARGRSIGTERVHGIDTALFEFRQETVAHLSPCRPGRRDVRDAQPC